MSVIKPRTRGRQWVQHRTRLDRENHETLYAYAAFLGEEPEYVLNELIDTVLAKDKEFLKWRAERPESFAPRPTGPRKAALGRDGESGSPRPAVTRVSSAAGEAHS